MDAVSWDGVGLMILPAQTIRQYCNPLDENLRAHRPMISPFCERTRHNGVTHGLSSNGYDTRIAEDIVLYPGSAVDVDTIERFDMPLDVCGRPSVKSTWARFPYRMLQIGTVIEAGWSGILRLEISMHPTAEPPGGVLQIPAGTGVVQVLFERLEAPTKQPYDGKYQNQSSGQDAIFEGPR
jgi:deoxycytidine triphosphate deaminase